MFSTIEKSRNGSDQRVMTHDEASIESAPLGSSGSSETQPPEGGLWAWLSVVSGFFVIMNTWGVFISFGVFQTYYVTALERSSSDISWIGSFEVFLLFFVGSIAGALTDAGYFRSTMTAGSLLILIGTFMTSISKAYWQVFLAQGVCTGLGNGLMFTPTMTVISTYFTGKRAVALAIAACGSTVGGLVFPSMARTLLPTIGFGWTMRAIGLIQLVTLIAALVVVRSRVTPKIGGAFFDWSAFLIPEYKLFAVGSFMVYIGLFFPIFYLASYARSALGLEYTQSLNLILVLNGVGIVGRLAPSFISPIIGPLNLFVVHVAITSLVVFLWALVTTVGGLYGWTVVFSLSMGGIQSLAPTALASVRFDPQKQGTLLGMVNTVSGFGALIGPAVSGTLIKGGVDYLNAQMFAASCMAAGAAILVLARETKRKKASLAFRSKL
ncbi:riboflavin transporter MCH5 [Verticillium dahliae VdLs.17]|uniref:Riboflavin transporter MCH5 n=2 Tax=Verticillium dahliae TaxID=27337 RepID=G2WU16_VERDV|nr:riboflavin transporter MCH5 [Verticillium dahliae VdLs.17]EGY17607.1 riboflavin transporter MCH5 [Verticillium dahliae VdLs.17]KAF3348381.1 SET domain-containing protein 8 [Verticillium dahliae VDG2]KAH6690924.1 riboflavin transporter MCH5 [Verticillium dahliae]